MKKSDHTKPETRKSRPAILNQKLKQTDQIKLHKPQIRPDSVKRIKS